MSSALQRIRALSNAVETTLSGQITIEVATIDRRDHLLNHLQRGPGTGRLAIGAARHAGIGPAGHQEMRRDRTPRLTKTVGELLGQGLHAGLGNRVGWEPPAGS